MGDGDRTSASRAAEQESRFRELAELLPETVFEVDLEGRITFASRRAFVDFGYDDEDLARGVRAIDMISDQDRERAGANILRVLAGGGSGPNEYVAVRKDGSLFPCLVHSAPIVREGRAVGIRGFILDLSDRKELEARVRRSERLEALGTLAGGVAHDFNNLLQAIQGQTSLMLSDLDERHPHTEHLRGINESVRAAAALVRELLAFARGGRHDVREIDVARSLETGLEQVRRARLDVRVRLELGDSPLRVIADRSQLEQVLRNLYDNACQAMPEGGDLVVAASLAELDAAQASALGLTPGRYVRIAVQDSGEGMDEATRQRVFEPFFTTREKGRGTGLGLAVVYGIVRGHRGAIAVRSSPGAGSNFTLHLPLAETRPARPVEDGPATSAGRVLLVDDEAVMTTVGQRLLGRLGYEVLVASCGDEAVRRLAEERGRVDLVVMDLVMPGLAGPALFDELRRVQPGLPIVVSSGLAPESDAARLLGRGYTGYLQKPFGLAEMSRAVRQAFEPAIRTPEGAHGR